MSKRSSIEESYNFIKFCLERHPTAVIGSTQLFEPGFQFKYTTVLNEGIESIPNDALLLFYKGSFSYKLEEVLARTTMDVPTFGYVSVNDFINVYNRLECNDITSTNIQWFAHPTLLSMVQALTSPIDFESRALYSLKENRIYKDVLDGALTRDLQVELLEKKAAKRLNVFKDWLKTGDFKNILSKAADLDVYEVGTDELSVTYAKSVAELAQFQGDDGSVTFLNPMEDTGYDFGFLSKNVKELYVPKLLADWMTRPIRKTSNTAMDAAMRAYKNA